MQAPGGVLLISTADGVQGSVLIEKDIIKAAVIPAETVRRIAALNVLFAATEGTFEFVPDGTPVTLNKPTNVDLKALVEWRRPDNPQVTPSLLEALQAVTEDQARTADSTRSAKLQPPGPDEKWSDLLFPDAPQYERKTIPLPDLPAAPAQQIVDDLPATLLHLEPILNIPTPGVFAPDRAPSEPPPPPPPPAEIFTKSVKNISIRYTAISAVVALSLLSGTLIVTSQILSENERTQTYKQGMQLLKDGYGDLARQRFDKVLKQEPQNVPALLHRAQANLLMKAPLAAAADYEAVVKLEPKNKEALRGRATAQLKANDFQQAILLSNQALDVDPDDAQSQLIKGVAYMELGEPDKAITATSAIIDKHPTEAVAAAYAIRADAFSRKNKWANARDDYTEALLIDPKNRTNYAGRAKAQFHLKKYQEAVADCTQAIFADGTNADLFVLRGRAYEKLGQFDKALLDYDQAVGFNPCTETLSARASVNFLLNNYNRAAADLKEILKDSRAEDKYKTQLALVQEKIKAQPVAPLNLEALVGRPQKQRILKYDEVVKEGYALLQQGRGSESVKLLSMAVQSNPQDLQARRYLAHAYAKAGDSDAAIAQLKLIQNVSALTEEDKYAYAEALFGLQEYAQTSDMAQSLVLHNPANYRARMLLIKSMLLQNRRNDAAEECRLGAAMAKSPEIRARFQHLYGRAMTWTGSK